MTNAYYNNNTRTGIQSNWYYLFNMLNYRKRLHSAVNNSFQRIPNVDYVVNDVIWHTGINIAFDSLMKVMALKLHCLF